MNEYEVRYINVSGTESYRSQKAGSVKEAVRLVVMRTEGTKYEVRAIKNIKEWKK